MKIHDVVAAAALLAAACHSSAAPVVPRAPEAGTAQPLAAGDDPWQRPATAPKPDGLPPAEDWTKPEPDVVEDAGPVADLDSHEILARATVADEVFVKHVLIGWKQLAASYQGRLDARAAARDNAAAAALASDIATKLRAQPAQIDALVKEHSEDPGSLSGEPYTIKPDGMMVAEFQALASRLKLNEIGVVKTQFGYHVMLRVPPPKLDPLESAKILARPANPGTVQVQHILIGWKDVPAATSRPVDSRAADRSKGDADKLAKVVFAKVKAGGNMADLMKQYSEDPGTKDTGKEFKIDAGTPFVEPFKKLSLRLKVGEAGMVRSTFGWHVIKRIAPPPLDALESADILKRKPVTAVAKVKHILVSDEKTSGTAGDPRGQKRTRAELEALVKKTVAALNAKAAIEPLMAELSEDPGSAKSGDSYDVTPDAGLVVPFKDLSLRLNVGEVGVVKTDFGFHIIQRTE
jgi:parvulin-like peptidyl-prolyl isomerase